MPWTFAHPALTLPLRRHLPPRAFAALSIGALAPDLGYYLGPWGAGWASHSLRGSLLIALPSAWALWLALRLLWPWLLAPLPDDHRRCWQQAWLRVAPRLARSRTVDCFLLSLCLWLGVLGHIGWDSLTHRNGYLALALGLGRPVAGVPAFRWLQHLSSAAGTLALVWVYLLALRTHRRTGDRKSAASWCVLVGCAAAGGMLIAADAVSALPAELQVRAWLVRTAIHATQIAALLWLVWGACLRLSCRRSVGPPRARGASGC